MLNSLSMALVKFTAPGIPDVYQGNEQVDLSLVDPDNRRPVDFDHRRGVLAAIQVAFEADRESLIGDMLASRAQEKGIELAILIHGDVPHRVRALVEFLAERIKTPAVRPDGGTNTTGGKPSALDPTRE